MVVLVAPSIPHSSYLHRRPPAVRVVFVRHWVLKCTWPPPHHLSSCEFILTLASMANTAFSTLPLELRQDITSYLSNSDINSLRLTCKQFNETVFLRVDRLFLSVSPLNVEGFRNIASHERFRHQVTEIVWDEARLNRDPHRTGEIHEGHELLSDEDEPHNDREWCPNYSPYYQEEIRERHSCEEETGCPIWFKSACQRKLQSLRQRKGNDVDRPDHIARQAQVSAQLPATGMLGTL